MRRLIALAVVAVVALVAVIMATFLLNAANRDEPLPRQPVPQQPRPSDPFEYPDAD